MRIDKYLWIVRLFKTRSLAAEACKSNRILVNDSPVKPSREIKEGDHISIKRMPAVFRFRVLGFVNNRQPARNVHLYLEDITPEEEFLKLEMAAMDISGQRDRGAGRPTKRDRRDLERWLDMGDDDNDDQ